MLSQQEIDQLQIIGKKVFEEQGDIHDLKYINRFDHFLNEKQHVIKALKLERAKPKKILDIGSGIGLLHRLLKDLGHVVTATDCDWEGHDHDYFKKIREFLGVEDYLEMRIMPFKKMKLKGKFDYIICTRSVFDEKWSAKEYKYWLHDAANHLNPRGTLYVKTNFIKDKDAIINDLLLPLQVPSSDKGFSYKATRETLYEFTNTQPPLWERLREKSNNLAAKPQEKKAA